jgi:hypothetical protein
LSHFTSPNDKDVDCQIIFLLEQQQFN